MKDFREVLLGHQNTLQAQPDVGPLQREAYLENLRRTGNKHTAKIFPGIARTTKTGARRCSAGDKNKQVNPSSYTPSISRPACLALARLTTLPDIHWKAMR